MRTLGSGGYLVRMREWASGLRSSPGAESQEACSLEGRLETA